MLPKRNDAVLLLDVFEGFAVSFLKVSLACLGSMATAVQHNTLYSVGQKKEGSRLIPRGSCFGRRGINLEPSFFLANRPNMLHVSTPGKGQLTDST